MRPQRRIVKCAVPPADRRMLSRYLRAVEPLNRGVLGVGVFVAALLAAVVLGGDRGLLLASTWLLFTGTWCLGNFWRCRETHCGVTGPGWTLAALAGFVAVLVPGEGLAWYSVETQIVATLVALGLGYGLELAVATTGRHALR